MRLLPSNQRLPSRLAALATALLISMLGGSLLLSADTPNAMRTAAVGNCYCHCAEARAHRSCIKMCELPKYASRRWATTCAKPRMKLPVEERDAGPRFEHPGRSERAQLSKPVAGS